MTHDLCPIPPVPPPFHTTPEEKLAWRTGYRIGVKTGDAERLSRLYPPEDPRRLAAVAGFSGGVILRHITAEVRS